MPGGGAFMPVQASAVAVTVGFLLCRFRKAGDVATLHGALPSVVVVGWATVSLMLGGAIDTVRVGSLLRRAPSGAACSRFGRLRGMVSRPC